MRALWLVRSNLEEHPGGDTTQILRTAAALRKRGISVVVSSDPKPDLMQFDVVHLFHLDRIWENARWCHQIEAARIPAVLSPIYWPSDEFDQFGRAGLQGVMSRVVGGGGYQNLRVLQRSAIPAIADRDFTTVNRHMFNFFRSARYILNTVDALLPNSQAEEVVLARRFQPRTRSFVIPNAAHERTFGPPKKPRDIEPNSVLCVGRIEPRKNQLSLIRALRNTDVHLQIVGHPGRFSHRYTRLCKKEAGPNVAFLGWKSASELRPLYQSARVHVSTSWYETPGLANLEAALSGCRLVVTRGGSTEEYFRDEVDYCPPNDLEAIQEAVRAALTRPRSLELSRRVAREYRWDLAAECTAEAYDFAMKRKGRRHEQPSVAAQGAG